MDNGHKHDHHRARFNQARIASKRQLPGGHMPKAMVTSDGEAEAVLAVLRPMFGDLTPITQIKEQLDLIGNIQKQLDSLVGCTPEGTRCIESITSKLENQLVKLTDKSILLDEEF